MSLRAVRYHEHGGPEVLRVEEVERPEPGEDEVLVEVRAAGVNPVDTYFREGTYESAGLPMIPGSDFSGKVVGTGERVENFERGDRVFGTGLGKDRQGTYAEYVAAPADRMSSLSEDVSFEKGAAIALVGVTAWRALIDYGELNLKKTCLIHGGSGGIGHAAVQLASTTGAEVIATAGSEDHREKVREFGADHVLDYGREDLKEAVRARSEDGIDVVLDHMLDKYLQLDLDVVGLDGTIVGIGESDGEVIVNNTTVARGKEVTLQLMSMFNTPDMKRILEKLARLLKKGKIEPEVWRTFPLEEADEAHRTVMEESFVGKIVIEIQNQKQDL